MKQTILVPTDFSNNALVATRYAIELSKIFGANIHIVHAYRPFTSPFQSPLANETDEQRATIGAKKGLAEFMEKLDIPEEAAITSSVEKNNLVDAITSCIDQYNVSVVIMGTHGSSGRRTDLLGSNTYDVANVVPRPLLIVPEDTAFFNLKNVVFFSDYQNGDKKSLRQFNNLFGKIGPACTLVHIHEHREAPQESDQKRLMEWKVLLEKETTIKLSVDLVHAPENMDVVDKILKRLRADMTLITLADTRGFFKKLIHKSLARAIILNPQTPILLTSQDTD